MSKGRGMACIEIEHAEMFARAFAGRRPGRRPGKPGDHDVPAKTWTETVDGIQSMDDNDDEPDFSRYYLHNLPGDPTSYESGLYRWDVSGEDHDGNSRYTRLYST